MPDPLDEYLASQQQAEQAEWDEHIDKRHEARRLAKTRPAATRNRDSVVSELETGSDELEGMDKVIQAQENKPQ